MYKVILQRDNRLINKLFNTEKAAPDKNLLFMDNLLKVLRTSFGTTISKKDIDFEIKEKPHPQDGQFIIVNYEGLTKYIFFSYERPEDTRNGYIVSKIPISLRQWYNDESTRKEFEVFLLDVSKDDYKKDNYEKVDFCNYSESTVNQYQTFAYKLCRTLGLRLLNYEKLPWNSSSKSKSNHAISNCPFSSLSEIRKMRDMQQRKNTGNKSSYILEDTDSVVIYGKTFGNNGFETILISAAVCQITKKKVYFWQIKDTSTLTGVDRHAKPITRDNLILLKEKLKIIVYDELQEYTENENAKVKERDARNQLEFKKNLMLKYGSDEPECYLCKCNVQDLIIASHIHRVCDINKESKPFIERRAEAVSAENGLWLCANHDKLFEYGSIYFDSEGGLLLSKDLTKEQTDFVKIISSKCDDKGCFAIRPEHRTDEMMTYLRLHRLRTHPHE